MSEDRSTWSVTCMNGGCDFSQSGISNDAAVKAANGHTAVGHATLMEHVVNGAGVVTGKAKVEAAEVAKIPAPSAPAKKAAAGKVKP